MFNMTWTGPFAFHNINQLKIYIDIKSKKNNTKNKTNSKQQYKKILYNYRCRYPNRNKFGAVYNSYCWLRTISFRISAVA